MKLTELCLREAANRIACGFGNALQWGKTKYYYVFTVNGVRGYTKTSKGKLIAERGNHCGYDNMFTYLESISPNWSVRTVKFD